MVEGSDERIEIGLQIYFLVQCTKFFRILFLCFSTVLGEVLRVAAMDLVDSPWRIKSATLTSIGDSSRYALPRSLEIEEINWVMLVQIMFRYGEVKLKVEVLSRENI